MDSLQPILSPSILSANFLHLGEEVEAVIQGGADWIHIDVMDGHFVPNISIGIPIIQCLKQGFSIPLDVHLMISHPQEFIDPFIQAGAHILTFHIEAASDPKSLCEYIRNQNRKVGIALKPKTPLESIKEYLDLLDMVLIMTVEPGFSGQTFIETMLDKIQKLRFTWQWKGKIQVDGGIHLETAKKCLQAGANVFVAASYLFQDNPKDRAKLLKEIISSPY